MSSPDPRQVVVVAYDGLRTFEFGIAVEVFGLERPELGVPWYRFRVCAQERGPLRAIGGFTVRAEGGLDPVLAAGTVVVPGWRDVGERPPAAMLRALCAAHENGARLVAICSGAFVLAAAGLLDGRRATTHWLYAERLAAEYPAVLVEPDILFVEDGDVWTSAGSAAGIDLGLHLVRRDYGAAIANQVARRLVMPPQRDGGQAQYVPAPAGGDGGGGLARVLEWAQGRLDEPLTVDRLARQAAMSPRHFARRFRDETGTTPHRWLTHQRLLAAQRLLETTDASIEAVAGGVGLQTAATLRFHFRRAFDTTPTAYRRRFSARRGSAAGH